MAWKVVEGCDHSEKMAIGAIPASFTGLKTRDSSLSFAKSMDFVRVSDMKRIKSGKDLKKEFIIRQRTEKNEFL